MLIALVVFMFVSGLVMTGSFVATSGFAQRRQIDRRLKEVSSQPETGDPALDATIVKRAAEGPLPGIDRYLSRTRAGSKLARFIEQSGVKTTPSALVIFSLGAAIGCSVIA